MARCFAKRAAAAFIVVISNAVGQLSTNGLTGHWDATVDASVLRTGSLVTEWKDQSSALFHVKVVNGNAPEFRSTGLNGQPGIYFEDLVPRRRRGAPRTNTGVALVSEKVHPTYADKPFTWFAILQTMKQAELGIQYIFSTNDAPKDHYDCVSRGCWDTSMPPTQRAVAIGGGGWNCWGHSGSGEKQMDDILLKTGTAQLVTLWSNGTVLRLYHSTDVMATAFVRAKWPEEVVQGYVSMGSAMLNPDIHQFRGYIGEVAAYNRALSEEEVQQSQNFLEIKWGLKTSTTTRSFTLTSITTSSNTVTMSSITQSLTTSSTTSTVSTVSSTTSFTTSSTLTTSNTNSFTSTSISITSSTSSTTLSSTSTATSTSSTRSSSSTTRSITSSSTSASISSSTTSLTFTGSSTSFSSTTLSYTSSSTSSSVSSTTISFTSTTSTASSSNTTISFTSSITTTSISSRTDTASTITSTLTSKTSSITLSSTSSSSSTTFSVSATETTLTRSTSITLTASTSSTLSTTLSLTSLSTSTSTSSSTTTSTLLSSTTSTPTASNTISTSTRSQTSTSTSSTATSSSCTETVSSVTSRTSTSTSSTETSSSTTSGSSGTFTSTSFTASSSTTSTTTSSTTTTSATANGEMVGSLASSLFEEPIFWMITSAVAIGAAASLLARRALSRIQTSFKQERNDRFTELADHDDKQMPLTDPAAPQAAKELPTTSHAADTWEMFPHEKKQEVNCLERYPADERVESVHMPESNMQPSGELPSSEDRLQMLRVAASLSTLQPTEPESEPPLLQLPGQMDSTRISALPCSAEEQVLKACQELVQDLEALFSSKRRISGACLRTELDSLLEKWSMRQLAAQQNMDSQSASMLRCLTDVVRDTIAAQTADHTSFLELKQMIETVIQLQIAKNAANVTDQFCPPAQDVFFFCETPTSIYSSKGFKRESIQTVDDAGTVASDVGLFRPAAQEAQVVANVPRCIHSEIELNEEERTQDVDETVDDASSAGEDSSDEDGEGHPVQTPASYRSWCPAGLDELQSTGDDLLQDLKVVLAFSKSGDLLLSELEELFEWWGSQHPSLLGDSAPIATLTNPGTNYRAQPPLLELARQVCLRLLNKGRVRKPATLNYSKLKTKIEDSWRQWMMDLSLSSGSCHHPVGLAAGSGFAQPRRRSKPFLLADMSESPARSRSAIAALRPLRTKSSQLLT